MTMRLAEVSPVIGRRSVPLSLAVAFALVLALALPAAAFPTADGEPPTIAGNHVDPEDCDEIGHDGPPDGNLVIDGTVLPMDHPSLLQEAGSLLYALHLAAFAAEAGQSVCVDADLSGLPAELTVDADIAICGEAAIHPGLVVRVAGLVIPDRLIYVDIVDTLEIAEVTGLAGCVFVTVIANDVFVDAVVTGCFTAALQTAGYVTIYVDDADFDLYPLEVVDQGNVFVEFGTQVEAGLEIAAFHDTVAHTGGTRITVVAADECPITILPSPPPAPGVGTGQLPDTSASVASGASGFLPALLYVIALAAAGTRCWRRTGPAG
jgi:hypothetical protein